MDYMNRPLVQALTEFGEKSPVSFHVPGHKNGLLSGLPFRSALCYDLTELEGLDDLHEPSGVIVEAQRKLSSLYGSDRSFFLVNGSTVGNLAMIYATCCAGDTIIVQRNAHKSIFHAIELTGAIPIFVSPAWDTHTRTAGPVTATQINEALELYPEAKAVVLTYPTYYGTTGFELEESIKICHTYKIPVLVDEAHGAHFVIGKPFPRSAMELGADVVVHSAHKTLPAMTMASFLHVQSKFIDHERIAHYLQMLQSSSPSYLLMASLDDARAYAESYNEQDMEKFLDRRSTFIQLLRKIPRLSTVETDDPLKLLLRIKGYSGIDVQKRLEEAGVYGELADPYQVLVVLPLLKASSDYPFEEISIKIGDVVAGLDEITGQAYPTDTPVILAAEISRPTYISSELRGMAVEWIPYKEAEGRVVAGSLIPYPPGIPLLVGGEQVTDQTIWTLKELIAIKAKFQGTIQVDGNKILVVR